MLPDAVPEELKTTAQLLLLKPTALLALHNPRGAEAAGKDLVKGIWCQNGDNEQLSSHCPTDSACSELLRGGGNMDQTSHTQFPPLKDTNQK